MTGDTHVTYAFIECAQYEMDWGLGYPGEDTTCTHACPKSTSHQVSHNSMCSCLSYLLDWS